VQTRGATSAAAGANLEGGGSGGAHAYIFSD